MKNSNNKTQIPNKSQNTMTQIPNQKRVVWVIDILVIGICFEFEVSNLGFPRLSRGGKVA
jgi:hypothetical protein